MYDIETLFIDEVLELLWKNHAENVPQKLVPGLFIILVNNPKQPFLKRIIKEP